MSRGLFDAPDCLEDDDFWPSKGASYPRDLYGGRPPSVPVNTSRGATTREEASRKALIVLETLQDLPDGVTSDKMEQILGWPHQTVSARLRELELKGYVYKSSDTRETRSKKPARVYRLLKEGPRS